MPIFFRFTFIFLLGTTLSFSQKGEETTVLLQKAKKELYINPEQSLKITEYILHNSNSENVLTESYALLSRYYFITGKYTLAVDNIMLAIKKVAALDNKDIQIETLLQAVEIFNFLDLKEGLKQYLDQANHIADGNANQEKKLKNYTLLYLKNASNLSAYQQILEETTSNELRTYASLTKGTLQTQLATLYLEKKPLDKAALLFEKDMDYLRKNAYENYWEMIAELHYSDYFFKNAAYEKATEVLNSALQKESIFKNSYFESILYEKLAKNYLVLKNKEKYREFNLKASALSNLVNNEKALAVNAAFDKLQNERAENIITLQEKENQTLWILGALALIIVLIGLFVRWQYKTRITYTSNIVNYLKLIKNSEIKPETPEKLILKSNQRPKETDELLLTKLAKFENGNKFLSKDISLAQLASQFDTNTKYLSEVINQYKEKNFNVYINELRIHYIVNKLKTDPIYLSYKVSYLAEECGFSTHSSFSTVFKNITGITPNVFIQFLTNDRIEKSTFSLN